jgi:uncharacterized protein YrzB (UPF0473 family)
MVVIMAEEFNDLEDMDLSTDFMTLLDDEGQEHMFEVLDAIETETGRYLAMIPHFEDAEEMLENDTELVIMKVLTDDEGEYLEALEDEMEFNAISAVFTERLGEDYDIQYPDEETEDEDL